MQRYLLGRVVQALFCIIVVATLVFVMVRMTGNPLDVLTDPQATEEDRRLVAKSLGLDKPLLVQYGIYIGGLARGDFGMSFNFRKPVLQVILERLPASLELTVSSMMLSIIIAVPMGVYSAVKKGSALDVLGRTFAFLGQSAPLFWTGLMGIWLFSVKLHLLPPGSRGGMINLVLPAFTLGWVGAAGILRLTRSSMLDALSSDYVTLARAKGLSEQVVIWKHTFKNAALPVLTFFVLLFVMLLGGAVVTETVFAWPGLGRLMMSAVLMRDFPIVQGVVILLSTVYIIANLLVDIAYAWLNPKIRYNHK
jgi:peptide/nickel transport system permease protein